MKSLLKRGIRNEGGGFAEILRLRSQLFWHSLSLIRRFSPLRMTKRSDARRSAKNSSRITAFPTGGRQREGGFAVPKGSQPRLAALGSPFPWKGLAWILPPSYGRRDPEGAEVGWGKLYEKERGDRLKYAITRAPLSPYRQSEYMHVWKNNPPGKAFPAWGRWRAERAG